MDRQRWHDLVRRWGAPTSDDTFGRLTAAYSEAHRSYHNTAHIADCLERLDESMSLAQRPEEVEAAIWFHDAIYRPMSSRNEIESADWAVRWLNSFGADADAVERVRALILATLHTADPLDGDAALLVDIDLSILGRAPEVYGPYERAIRQEYRWVPGPLYRRKRVEILKSFLHRPQIYTTEPFRDRYETQARANLQRVIDHRGRWGTP